MINARSLARFQPLGGRLLRPIYDDYSFANIPNTVEFLLTGTSRAPLLPPDCFGGTYPRADKVVLIFIDSFGWQFWQGWGRKIPNELYWLMFLALTCLGLLLG